MRTYDPRAGVNDGDDCPACGHDLARDVHTDYGCDHGWQWDGEGGATVEGCPCALTVAPNRT